MEPIEEPAGGQVAGESLPRGNGTAGDDGEAVKKPARQEGGDIHLEHRVVVAHRANEACNQCLREQRQVIHAFARALVEATVAGQNVALVHASLQGETRVTQKVAGIVEQQVRVRQVVKDAGFARTPDMGPPVPGDPDYSPSQTEIDLPFVDDPDIPGPR